MKTYSEKEKNISFSYFFSQLKQNWYLYAISLIIFLGLGYTYNWLATKYYLTSSTMLLQAQPITPDPSSQYANGGVSSALNLPDNVKNEGDVLRSRNLIKEVVQDMRLNIKTFSGTGILASEIYQESPFSVQILRAKVDTLKKMNYDISIIDNKKLTISNEDESVSKTVFFGKPIHLPQYDIVIFRAPGITAPESSYSFQIVSEDDAIIDIQNNYDAEFVDKSTTTIGLTLYYPNSKKGEAILQNIMSQYLVDNIDNKRRIIDSTINFINSRIASVEGELNNVEKNYQEYRANNSIADIAEQSRVLEGNANEYANKYQQQKIQLSIVNDLRNRLSESGNRQVIPSSLSIQNASFAASLDQYNSLLTQRAKERLSYTDTNPVIVNLDQQIELVRHNLLESISSYEKEMQLNTAGLSNQNSIINSSIRQAPEKQRTVMDFNRQQDLKHQLYIYLLQKREEASMAQAADMPYSRIIDNAKSTKAPAKPIKPIIYVMTFFLGLIVPFGYVNAKNIFASKINSDADIEKQTDVEIIGKIGHHSMKNNKLLDAPHHQSIVAESFRTLRTKLRNILNSDQSNVIMVTSSVNGEGKTFLTWNLGNILALSEKKVVLIELDLRKPKLSSMIGIDNKDFGFSNYVIDDLDVDSIIKPSALNSNLSIISSGPVVVNASELLLSYKLPQLINELKKKFDFIILDSSPIGLVSDALIIQKQADMTIYVCRHNYTDKAQIDIINDLKTKDNVDNIYLVVNDVNFAKAGYTGYGYGMGYGNYN
ncbi:polysaccharide biosynthesis tyrosine autokinase [Pedobacter sp. HMF7647]|uniref:non-specific protein-tyrosine kinase n=1 Tax=Hufsiella arboris TaxID=2695275 RepID=A0A7K1Y9P4_9SPHI|nr:tyrosine-protein kinase [Hufsiella arboris]MXV51305.1 polysaccharide biosynthesis tyrosine autokinase [Hufsiella arboris]